jgi:tetratricopeptide (TPR) repeat protein
MEKKLAKEFNNKGFDLFKQESYPEAIEEFDKALELNQNYKEALYNKALSLFLLKKNEESLNEIDKALSINEKYSKAINLKGLILTSINRFYEAVLEYDKEFEVVGKEDGSFYFNKGIALSNFDYNEAIENFKKAISYNFDVEQSQKELNDLEKKISELNEK